MLCQLVGPSQHSEVEERIAADNVTNQTARTAYNEAMADSGSLVLVTTQQQQQQQQGALSALPVSADAMGGGSPSLIAQLPSGQFIGLLPPEVKNGKVIRRRVVSVSSLFLQFGCGRLVCSVFWRRACAWFQEQGFDRKRPFRVVVG